LGVEGEIAVMVGEVEASHLAGGDAVILFDGPAWFLVLDELLGVV